LLGLLRPTLRLSEKYAAKGNAIEGVAVVIGRTDYEIAWIVHSVERALAVGLIPALVSAWQPESS
jgi:hypothetical protein